jgi:hypothetical protein
MSRLLRISPSSSIVLLLLVSSSIAARFPDPPSVSTSRQFIVYGRDRTLRGLICDLAETTKLNLLRLLQLRDEWRVPLIVRLDEPQANFPEARPNHLEVSQLGYGLKLQLDLPVTGEIQAGKLQPELLRAILIEMIYRNRGNVAPGTRYVAPPDWLLEAVLALQLEHDPDEGRRVLRTVVASDRIAPLEDIVRQDRTKLDSSSRQLFRSYSQALLQLLLGAPDGRRKLARYLTDLPDSPNDNLADLVVHFPETLGRAPGKWWALSVAQLSASDRYRVLSAGETAARLDQILGLSIPGSDGVSHRYSLGDFSEFEKLPAALGILTGTSRQLLLLGAQAHPSYQPVIRENDALVRLLARGETRGVRERLERIASYRRAVKRQTEAIADYLNWYEATQFKTMSGAFTELLNSSEKEEQPRARRHDPISVYLDFSEMEMQ